MYVRKPGEKSKNLALSACYAKYCIVNYAERDANAKKNSLEDRIYYSPVLKRDPQHKVERVINLGTMEGEPAESHFLF